MSTSPQYYDLIETFHETGCAICHLLQRDATRFIDSLLYEYVTKLQTNDTFRSGRGLCNTHSWQMAEFTGRALGIAMLSNMVVDEIQKVTAKSSPGQSSGLARLLNKQQTSSSLADALESTEACPVCDLVSRAEQHYVEVIATHLDDSRFIDAFQDSGGLCLPHVRQTLRQITDPAQSETFMKIQGEKWATLQAELKEFIRKYDINNAREAMGAEGDSWRRAIRYLAGEDDIFGLRR
jgi:hypothetical protein